MLFRPSLWLTILAAVLATLTFNLALWQFDRAEQKRALEDAAAAAMTAAAVTVRHTQAVTPFQRAALLGEYLPAQEILLDNRVQEKRVGYHVLTPFELTDGGVVMVNRGWLAGDGTRREPAVPPPPSGQITVQGIFYRDGADAFRLAPPAAQERVRQNLDLAAYSEESALPLLPLLLIKEADADTTLPPVPVRRDYKSRQSTVYAWQWLTFCLLTVVFYFLLSFRKPR